MKAEQVHPLQTVIDGLGLHWQKERSKTGLTLGNLIEELEALELTRMIRGIVEPHSYRGYYSDLAFEPTDKTQSVEKALNVAKSCMGEIFVGYKGGDFQMGRNTPVWIATYGLCSDRLMKLDTTNDVVALITAPEKDF